MFRALSVGNMGDDCYLVILCYLGWNLSIQFMQEDYLSLRLQLIHRTRLSKKFEKRDGKPISHPEQIIETETYTPDVAPMILELLGIGIQSF